MPCAESALIFQTWLLIEYLGQLILDWVTNSLAKQQSSAPRGEEESFQFRYLSRMRPAEIDEGGAWARGPGSVEILHAEERFRALVKN